VGRTILSVGGGGGCHLLNSLKVYLILLERERKGTQSGFWRGESVIGIVNSPGKGKNTFPYCVEGSHELGEKDREVSRRRALPMFILRERGKKKKNQLGDSTKKGGICRRRKRGGKKPQVQAELIPSGTRNALVLIHKKKEKEPSFETTQKREK